MITTKISDSIDIELGRLIFYPKLAEAYCANLIKGYCPVEPHQKVIFEICSCLTKPDCQMVAEFNSICQNLMETHDDIYEAFNSLELYLSEQEVMLSELLSIVAEQAVLNDMGKQFFSTIKDIGDQTDLPIFRFIAAWLAFNIDLYQPCIEECEKITEAFAPAFTLQGQAHLEHGYPRRAIDALLAASQISPNDPLIWFQLAKSYHVIDMFDESWSAIEKCVSLVPDDLEAAAFMAIIAKSNDQVNENQLEKSWSRLSEKLSSEPDNPYMVKLLLELAIQCNSEKKVIWLANHINLDTLRKDDQFCQELADTVKIFEKLEWSEAYTLFGRNELSDPDC